MPVDLTPRGTRGWKVPDFYRTPLGRRAVNAFLDFMVTIRGGRLLKLTTTGAKSGNPRTVTLSWFLDESRRKDAWLVIASFGGAAAHPAWYINLAKHPDQAWVNVGKDDIKVRAESLEGDERVRAWARITAKAPTYLQYQSHTDREIPVVRLTAAI